MIVETKESWTFATHALHDGREFVLKWDTFHFERIEVRHIRQEFCKSTKAFLRVSLARAPHLGVAPSPGSMLNRGMLLRRFVRWMIEQGIFRFSALSQADLTLFLESRIHENGGSLTNRSIWMHRQLFQELWEYRQHYTHSLQVDPNRSGRLNLLVKGGKSTRRWDPVAIEIMVPLLRDAIHWLDSGRAPLLNVVSSHVRIRGPLRGLTKHEMRTRSRDAYQQMAESSDDLMWLQEKLGNGVGARTIPDLVRVYINISIGAAITVILFLSGIRCSEMLSLRKGCYSFRRHNDGRDYSYIRGVAAKKGGIEKEWVVPEPVIKALTFLEELRAVRDLTDEDGFLFSIPNRNGMLPPPFVSVSRLWPSSAADLLRLFARGGWRLNPVRTSLRLHPHQARKTFARCVVLRDKRGLEALAQHYGHVSSAVLDSAYVGSDVELHQLLDEESERDLAEGLTELLTSEALGGKAGHMLENLRNEVRTKFRGKTALASLVKRLIRDGVTLAPCDWGYCVYAKDQSACGGDATGPNPITREPTICSTCPNFAVTEVHRSWWEERAVRETKFLKIENLSEQTIAIVELRRAATNEVLATLNRAKYPVAKKRD